MPAVNELRFRGCIKPGGPPARDCDCGEGGASSWLRGTGDPERDPALKGCFPAWNEIDGLRGVLSPVGRVAGRVGTLTPDVMGTE